MEEAPKEELKLRYVHGYRCFDARNTAKFTNNVNNIVFVQGALGVTLDIKSNK